MAPGGETAAQVLVTGASGFIGRHLVARLVRQGAVVRALVRGAAHPSGWPDGVEVVHGDVRDAVAACAASAGAGTIYHLAGKAHDTAEIGDSAAYGEVTVAGTETLLGAALEAGVRRVVFVSSLAVYGPGLDAAPRDETAPLRPATAYGRAKLRAEKSVLDFGARTGAHVCCLRPATVYGPGAKGNLPRMVGMIDRGLFPPLPDSGNRRSMVHVDDLVDALLLAASSPAAGGCCFNVTDCRAYGARELYEMICRATARRPPRWRIPLACFRALAAAGDIIGRVRGRRAGFDGQAFEVLFGSAWFSAEHIARELGYRPSHTLEDALPAMVADLRRVVP